MANDEFLKFLEEEFGKMQEEINTNSLEDFENLSPADMHHLIYEPFGPDSVIQYKDNVPDEIYDQLGFFRMIEFLLDKMKDGQEIKLTKWNNLNTKLVTEMYKLNFTGEEVWSMKERKVYKQEDLLSVQNAVFLLRDSFKIVKVRNNKMSLTKKGADLMNGETRKSLFRNVFQAYALSLNWGYHDGYDDDIHIQKGFGYVLFLLLQYGQEERGESFYGDKMVTAFPHILHVFKATHSTPEQQVISCLSIRCFQRFLNWFNLIKITHNKYTSEGDNILFHNHLLTDIFELNKSKFKFKKEGFKA